MLGAFEVSGEGDLANWTTNNPIFPPGVGGAMDLAAGAKEVWVLTEHQTKDGNPKIVNKCSYPLTSAKCVKRIFTDLAIMSIGVGELIVEGMVEAMTIEELQRRTEPKLRLSSSSKVLVAPDL